MIRVQINGLREVMKRIEKVDKALATKVGDELTTGARNIESQAKAYAPKGRTGELAGSIEADVSQPYDKRVSVSAPYAPFVEFGTGVRVFQNPSFNFTPEIRAYAMEFYVNGLGKQPAHPYLFPAFEQEKLQIIKRIKKVLFDI